MGTINSRPGSTVTTNVLSGGISSTLPPPPITSSTHYHAVVCNSATCLGDRVITTPSATPHASSLSPPHQMASRPEQVNQAPREHTQPPSAHLASWEELNSAIANVLHNVQDMLTNMRNHTKEETATPQDAQHTYHQPRRNNYPPCQCHPPSSRERSPTPPSSPKNAITNHSLTLSSKTCPSHCTKTCSSCSCFQ